MIRRALGHLFPDLKSLRGSADMSFSRRFFPALLYMSFSDDPEVCRGILESIPTGLCAVDMGRKIVFWSNGAERLTGRMRHEVIGHSCIDEPLLRCDHPACEFSREDCSLARAIKTSQPAECNGFLRHRAGHEVPVRIRAVPIHNQHGSIIGAFETFDELAQGAATPDREGSLHTPGLVDEVTGVASHAMMQAHLREALITLSDVQVSFGVLLFRLEGIDHFRVSFGPEATSSLLRVVARTLETSLWKTDFVGRWLDDQFLVILNGCNADALGSVRERIRRMLAGNSIEWWGERRFLPIAIGQAIAQLDDTIDSLLQRAKESLDTGASLRTQATAAGASPSSGS